MNAERNPYVGPRSFGSAETDLFFGREAEARDLARVAAIEQVTILCGASGVGKTSLINARLIPALLREGYVVLPTGRVGGVLPAGVERADNVFIFNLMVSIDAGGDPARLAHVTLSDFLTHLVSADGEDWKYDPAAALAPPQAEGRPLSGTRGQPVMLIIDQFEEIITSHPAHWQEREDFFRQLNQELTVNPNLGVVLTLREDYVASLDPYAPLMTDRLRVRFYMERMDVTAALDAIRKPAELAGRPFAPGVAEKLVDDLRQMRAPGEAATVAGQYVEPVQLQVVCYQLWENIKARPTGPITEADLRQAGNLDQALTQFYEETLAVALADPEAADVSERQLRAWFDRVLITEAGTRGLAFQGEREAGGLPNGVVRALQQRLLVDAEARGGDTWIELVHDRFIEPIRQSNRAWFARKLNPLTQAAQAWREAGRVPELLYSGAPLAAALAQERAHPDEFGEVEREFLQASREAEVQRRARARRQRAITWGAIGLALVFVALAILAWRNQEKAQGATRRAKANELAASAAMEINKWVFDPSLALLLAVEGVNRTLSVDGYVAPNADAALQDAVAAGQRINWQMTLTGHTKGIGSAAYSPDGQHLVTASVDETARIWDASTGQEVRRLTGHTGRVNSAAYSPDGQTIVTASGDTTARLWDASTGQAVRQLSGHAAGVISAAYSPDGRFIVTTGCDRADDAGVCQVGSARIWDARTGQALRALAGHTGQVWDAAYSPDGQTIVTAGCDQANNAGQCQVGSARIWDARTGQTLGTLTGQAGRVVSAAYSLDGKTIVTAGCDWVAEAGQCRDGSARIWDVATRQELRTLTGHSGEVLSAAYSPDGKTLVTTSADWTARIWDASIEELLNEARRLIQRDPAQLTPRERQRYGLD